MNNKVSIIIATYNQSSKIGDTLDSLIEQTFFNWECIVADDKSTDDTKTIVNNYEKKDSRIKYFLSPNSIKKGPNGARNYGFTKSTGNLLMSLDSDDLLSKNHLELKVEAFENNPNIDAVISKTILIDDDLNEIRKEDRTFLTENLLEDFITLKVSWYMHDTMWRKEFLKGKTLYNENLLKMLDRDFHIRRLLEKPNFFLLDKFISFYRVYSNSNSTNHDIKVVESRHRAVIDIIINLKSKNALSKKMAFYFLKFQIQNVVVLYRSKYCLSYYAELIKYTFTFDMKNIKWLIRLFFGYMSFKFTGKGLIFVK